MIAILNYGLGNLGSIQNMLRAVGAKCKIVSNPEEARQADKYILPGVGKFDAGMKSLNRSGLREVVEEAATLEKPILGICLGMQLLGLKSEEGSLPGLGLIPFKSVHFAFNKEQPNSVMLKVPHMGWDMVDLTKETLLTSNLANDQRYYFVHSYYAICENKSDILMTCDYGITFAAAVNRGNVYGVQFHPEKSHDFGMALLSNFAEVC